MMIRPRRPASMLLVPLVLSLTAGAAAQPRKPAMQASAQAQAAGKKKPLSKAETKTQNAEAKRLFDEGAKHYTEGNYEKAIDAWEMSYEISKKELIFESIANAYERLGQPKKAHEYLSKWRAAAPPDEHATLDTRLKNLDDRAVREEQLEKEKQAQKERERQEAQAGASSGPPLLGIVLAGAGAAALVTGVTLDIIAATKRPDEAEACRSMGEKQLCRASDRDAIESSNTLAFVGDVLWIAGGVAAAAGVVLIVTHSVGSDAPKADATALRIAPVVTPRGGGLFVGKSF